MWDEEIEYMKEKSKKEKKSRINLRRIEGRRIKDNEKKIV